jgi:hypothetical protein
MRILSMVMVFTLKSKPRLGHASSLVNDQVVHRCLSLKSYSTVLSCLF